MTIKQPTTAMNKITVCISAVCNAEHHRGNSSGKYVSTESGDAKFIKSVEIHNRDPACAYYLLCRDAISYYECWGIKPLNSQDEKNRSDEKLNIGI